jgi:amidohydrolase
VDAKQVARDALDRHAPALVGLSHRIHAHPELKWEEVRASAWAAGVLSDAGHTVEVGVCDVPTAFACRIGDGPLHVAICAEYDALPGIGHACGHNVIAAAAVGAGLALAPLVDELGLTVTVVGTPAEEGGGGKVLLLERGAFDGVHAACMVHPAPVDLLRPRVTAVSSVEVRYTGREAHAAAAPDRAVNAGDAFVVAQVAIGLLRQHLPPTDQVHGVVVHGGDVANVVPAHTRGEWMIRARDVDDLAALRPRVERCFEAGALATGASLEIDDLAPTYTHMEHDHDLVEAYRANAEALGRTFPATHEMTFSTDMGNVSLQVPSIHPCIGVESGGATIHQPGFADAAISASADRAVVDGALGLAWTVVDAATDAAVRGRLLGRAGAGQPPGR